MGFLFLKQFKQISQAYEVLADSKKGSYMIKEESRRLKRVEQVVVLAHPWISLICSLEEEEGCREKGEVKMLCISSQ